MSIDEDLFSLSFNDNVYFNLFLFSGKIAPQKCFNSWKGAVFMKTKILNKKPISDQNLL